MIKISHLWIVSVVFSLLAGAWALGAQQDKENEINRLAKSYRAARTEFDRRAVCLDAIDAGIIARGRPVGVVDRIFGTNYAKDLPPGSELEIGGVYFRTQLPSTTDTAQVARVGWYLSFKFDSKGALQDYYLSNLHKLSYRGVLDRSE